MDQSLRKVVMASAPGRAIYDFLRLIRDTRVAYRRFGVTEGKLNLFHQIRQAQRQYGWYPDEFFMYHFLQLSDEQRRSFISEREHVVVADMLNGNYARSVLSDKWTTYEQFRPFFQREAVKVTRNGGGNFKNLLFRSGRLILKPFDGSFGKGIRIVTKAEWSESFMDTLLKDYPKGFIAEEVVEQDPRMAALHPESVNTLRVHTVCFDGRVTVFHPYVRIGRGNSVVDNAGSGGVFTSCNQETGQVINIVDEYDHTYTCHPDNGFPLKGFHVPCWDAAFDIARRLALYDQKIHYAGWDLTLSATKGWVLIEGNPRAQFVFQISEQKGFRHDLQKILRSYGIEYPEGMPTKKIP